MLRAVFLLLGLLVATQAVAQSERNKLYFDGAPPWVTKPASTLGAATVDLDFANGRFWPSYTLSRIAVTRASVAEEDSPDGVWYPFVSGQLRFTAKGALVEEGRTNSVRNNTMTGAVAGSPGTAPTNWVISVPTGLTRTIALSTVSGLACSSWNYTGTTSSTAAISFQTDGNASIASVYGQTWVGSAFTQVTHDDPAVTTLTLNTQTLTSGAAIVDTSALSIYPTRLSFLRATTSVTGSLSTIADIRQQIATNSITSGTTINFTILLCAPQLERNSNLAGSVASAAVNAAGSGYGNALTGTMTWATGGTCATPPVLNVTSSAGGAIATVNSVTTAGSCSVFPTAAATWTPGGGLSAGTSATFTLTPTDNSAAAGATSPILTTSAAATRAADVVTMTLPAGATSTSGYSILGIGTPELPTGYSPTQVLGQIDDGTANNRLTVQRQTLSGAATFVEFIASVSKQVSLGTWAQNTQGTLSTFAASGSLGGAFNGGAPTTTNPVGGPAVVTRLAIGTNATGGTSWNGYIPRLVVAPASLLAN